MQGLGDGSLTACESACAGSGGPVCPEWLQEQLLSWLIEGAEAGRPGFKEMLTLTRPCDIFPLLRGRTLWLMGDFHDAGRPLSKWLNCQDTGHVLVPLHAPVKRESSAPCTVVRSPQRCLACMQRALNIRWAIL